MKGISMEESRVKTGVYITISDNISKTDSVHGSNSDMSKMKGKTYQIEGFRSTSRGMAALVQGFLWHPDDLAEQSTEKNPEPFHFDIKELII